MRPKRSLKPITAPAATPIFEAKHPMRAEDCSMKVLSERDTETQRETGRQRETERETGRETVPGA